MGFHGNLDIKTLGGAGFASQRTTGDERKWDLSQYAGIELQVSKGDKKRYTFILKDELLPPNPENGREQATISYETDFELPPQTVPGETRDRYVFIPFKSLNPTYRGKLQKDAPPLDTSNVKRMSIMMKSLQRHRRRRRQCRGKRKRPCLSRPTSDSSRPGWPNFPPQHPQKTPSLAVYA